MRWTLLVMVMLLGTAAPARAFEDFVGTRALGTGGASRAWASGGSGPLLNPSGMSLTKGYNVEGDYGFSNRRTGHFFHASVVDSTSALTVAGGLYYTYHLAYPDQVDAGHGHEAGMALSLPLGEYLAIGGTLKYFRLQGDDAATGGSGGITFDLGATVRPMSELSLAVVGTNLRDLRNGNAPRGIGYGVALLPAPSLALVIDGVTNVTPDPYTGRKGTSVMAGGDYLIAQRFDARLGVGYEGGSGNFYASAGFSVVGEIAAIDVGVRQDFTQHQIEPGVRSPSVTVVGVALRLFVPVGQQTNP